MDGTAHVRKQLVSRKFTACRVVKFSWWLCSPLELHERCFLILASLDYFLINRFWWCRRKGANQPFWARASRTMSMSTLMEKCAYRHGTIASVSENHSGQIRGDFTTPPGATWTLAANDELTWGIKQVTYDAQKHEASRQIFFWDLPLWNESCPRTSTSGRHAFGNKRA